MNICICVTDVTDVALTLLFANYTKQVFACKYVFCTY